MDRIIPTVPVLPISYGDAEPLLRNLADTAGVPLPEGWQGGLDFEYQIGPGTRIGPRPRTLPGRRTDRTRQ